jgi:hypothetical protein
MHRDELAVDRSSVAERGPGAAGLADHQQCAENDVVGCMAEQRVPALLSAIKTLSAMAIIRQKPSPKGAGSVI